MKFHVKEPEDDDRKLMLRFQHHGDERAFDRLFVRHKTPLIAFLYRMAQSRTQAEEISQVVWLKVIETAGKGQYVADPNASFRTWLFTLARNAMLDDVRRQQRVELVAEPPEGESNGDDPVVREVAEHQIQEHLAAAVRGLPIEQREVVALWSAGISYEEISTQTGAALATVIGRKRYALNRLRQELEDAGLISGRDRGTKA